MARQKEGLLKERVLADLRALPRTYAVKIQQVCIRGTPDILACIAGQFVALELKRDEKQKPDPLQQHELDKIGKAGGTALVVDPLNWPGILAGLQVLAFHDASRRLELDHQGVKDLLSGKKKGEKADDAKAKKLRVDPPTKASRRRSGKTQRKGA